MSHEDLRRDETVATSSDRSFGIVFAVVFLLIAVGPWLLGGPFHAWALVVSAGFLLAALAVPSLLAPLNRVWAKFGLLLHRVVSPIVLGFMFYVVITPIGMVLRLLGKDTLRLRYDPGAKSYWIAREPPGPAPESMKDQF